MLNIRRLLIAYSTGNGNTRLMAESIREGAEQFRLKVDLKKIEKCSLKDLLISDGIIIGSPTYFSNVSWQVKKLIDESIILFANNHQLKGKIGGSFTSSATFKDGQSCLKLLELAFGLHHKMKMVPGIIRTSVDKEEKIVEICQQYGSKIAKKILL
jgi:NAD(P)H dehydrogenase (quinone)